MPGTPVLDLVTADLDSWFRDNNRGEENAFIEPYAIDGEFWFLVRHGDTFARLEKLERGRRLRMLHFRPAKNDVVVYTPERDEIRIHAGTKGERELYRRAFGKRLLDDDRYFSERKAFTLEPLRAEGAKVLERDGDGEVARIVLREIEVAFGGGFNDVVIRKSDDVFAAALARGREAIPDGGRLIRAAFDFWFTGAKKPRKVQVRPPNVLKLGGIATPRLFSDGSRRRSSGRACGLGREAQMASPWQCLEDFRGPVGVLALWRAGLGDRFDGFNKAFLRKRLRRADSYPCPHGCACAHDLVPRPDGSLTAVCACDPPNCDGFTVTPAEAALLELNWTRLGLGLCGALKADARDTDLGVPGARQIGAFSSAAVPVVLSVQDGRRDFRSAVAGVIAAVGKPFILLAPTSQFVDGFSLGRLKGAGARFFDLESHVLVLASGALRAVKDPMEVFAEFLPSGGGPEPPDYAKGLFALVGKLEAKGKWRKASPLTVFRLYFVRQLSRAKVAAECDCVPGLVTLRLKQLERELKMSRDQLFGFSPQFQAIEDAASNPLAGGIYRKGMIYGGVADENEGRED